MGEVEVRGASGRRAIAEAPDHFQHSTPHPIRRLTPARSAPESMLQLLSIGNGDSVPNPQALPRLVGVGLAGTWPAVGRTRGRRTPPATSIAVKRTPASAPRPDDALSKLTTLCLIQLYQQYLLELTIVPVEHSR